MSAETLLSFPLLNHYCFRGRLESEGDLRTLLVASPSEVPGGETFDLIACTGLHHEPDPAAALQELRARLRPGGAIGLTLYARYARATVGRTQTLLRLLNVGVENEEALRRSAIDVLRQMRSNGISVQIPQGPDALYDLYLRPVEHTFTVLEIYELLERADLHFVDFGPEFHPYYDPTYTFSGEAWERVMRLPVPLQSAAAELFWGLVPMHRFWASTEKETVADPRDPANVPFFLSAGNLQAEAMRQAFLSIPPGQSRSVTLARPGGMPVQLTVQVDEQSHALVELIDGRRTMAEIALEMSRRFQSEGEAMLDWCASVLESFRAYDIILLKHRPPKG